MIHTLRENTDISQILVQNFNFFQKKSGSTTWKIPGYEFYFYPGFFTLPFFQITHY